MVMGHSMLKNSLGRILFASLNVVNMIRKSRIKGKKKGKKEKKQTHQKLLFVCQLCPCRQVLAFSPATETQVFELQKTILTSFQFLGNSLHPLTGLFSKAVSQPMHKMQISKSFYESFKPFLFGHAQLISPTYFQNPFCFGLFCCLLWVWVLFVSQFCLVFWWFFVLISERFHVSQ